MPSEELFLHSLSASAALSEDDPRQCRLVTERAADTVMEWQQRECDAAIPMAQCLSEVLRQCPQPLRSRFETLFNAWRGADREYHHAVWQLVERSANIVLPPYPEGGA